MEHKTEQEIRTDNKDETQKLTACEKVRFALSHITVEPLMMCCVLPTVMASLTTQNLNLEKTCRVNLQYNETICNAISSKKESTYKIEEIAVQKLVAAVYIWKNVVQSVLPIAILPFLGSWADRRKCRKHCILLPIFGDIIATIGLLICTYFFNEIPLELTVIIHTVPAALTGGFSIMFVGVFSYIGSVSSTETRTLRIGIANLIFFISVAVGSALSGFLYKKIGFYGIYSTALVIYALGILYGIFVVKEDKTACAEVKTVGFLRDFFDLQNVRNTFKVVFKEGDKNLISKICLLMILIILVIGPVHGEFNVLYLFTRYKFNWNEIDFSIYCTFSLAIHLLGTMFSLLVMSKFFKLDDAFIGCISSSSKVCASAIYAFAANSTAFYLGTLVEILSGTSLIVFRSMVSKLGTSNELSQLNSVIGMAESSVFLLYLPMYSAVYEATINVFPGTIFVISGILTIFAVALFTYFFKENNKQNELKTMNLDNTNGVLPIE